MSNLKWKCPIKETPPTNKELLLKSPDGAYIIGLYRPSYRIFTCQNKNENMYDWQYFVIEDLNQNKDEENI